jgi:diguanylate cyclase (GGDEF)-like protein/PAS domain S-box-containing protein
MVSIRLSPVVRVSASMVCLMLSVLFLAAFLGLVPQPEKAILQGRRELCETLAIHCSLAAQRRDLSAIMQTIEAVMQRNEGIVSARVRDVKGRVLLKAGACQPWWSEGTAGDSNSAAVCIPIALQDKLWGTVELGFKPPATGSRVWFGTSMLPLSAFMALAGFPACFIYLRRLQAAQQGRVLQAIPQRIRDTLNTLAEGVLILDKDERIALANEAFASIIDQSPDELRGRKVSELPWTAPHADGTPVTYPWAQSLSNGTPQMGRILALRTQANRLRRLSVNSTPIFGDDGSRRGALATFDNLTAIERKNTQLRKLLHRLKQSRAEIRRRNRELKALATRDPLTSCLNRRSFFAEFETQWSSARRYEHALSCVMLDVDYFKWINDRHGHGIGDQVLQQVAERLKAAVRHGDLVCRYGGEEFCILLPHTDLTEAAEAAERFRQEIGSQTCVDVMVTASFGVSSLSLGALEPRELLDQADRALYAAKRGGRNRVVRWDEILDQQRNNPAALRAPEPFAAEPETRITFHAVSALVAALAYHSLEAAEHSRRVADLCVAVARRLLPLSQCYLLEVAALLHDIGKLGVPDALLSKSEALTEEEWKLIRSHEQMGHEIIMAAFTSEELRHTIRYHHCWYGGDPTHAELPKGEDIPLGARILAIADAFDSMTSDRVYRKGKSPEEAFAELRRWAGTQFDPDLAERFISVVSVQDENRTSVALVVSKQTALQLGLQVEKLASAVDARDYRTLRLMAGRIHANACGHGIDLIARIAAQLEQAALPGGNWVELTQLTLQLLDLCRSTYVSYLPRPGEKGDGLYTTSPLAQ